VALLAVVLLIAGCGGDGDSGTSGGGSTSSGAGEIGEAAQRAKAEDFGSEASKSQAKPVEAALLGYLDARANGDWEKACSYLAKDLRQLYNRIGSKSQTAMSCPDFVAGTTERLSQQERTELAEIEVESVRLDGNSGYVIYTDAAGAERTKPVSEEGGSWKVSSLLATLAASAR